MANLLVKSIMMELFLEYVDRVWCCAFVRVLIFNTICCVIALLSNTNTLIDFAWYCNSLVIGVTLFLSAELKSRSWILLVVLTIYTLRGAGHLLLTRVLKGANDKRYLDMAKQRGFSPNIMLIWQFILQAFLVMIPALPLFFMFRGEKDTIFSYAGAAIAFVATILTHIADSQLREFQLSNHGLLEGPKKTFRGGLWAKSRHPNLFFEVAVWVGFALAGVDGLVSLIGFMGPLTLWAIMRFLTVPITERAMAETRPDWSHTLEETNMFLPF